MEAVSVPKNFDALLQFNILSMVTCNMNCVYCFKNPDGHRLSLNGETLDSNVKRPIWSKLLGFLGMHPSIFLGKLRFKLELLSNRPKIHPINIPALMRTLEETGKIFKISFSGGEPFLIPNIIEACLKITEKHFVALDTNLVAPSVKKFIQAIDPKRVVYISASLHIKELERLRKTHVYIENFLLCQKKSFYIRASVVAYPPLFNEVKKYKQFFAAQGIEFIFSPFRGSYQGKNYPESYTVEELQEFGLEQSYESWFGTFGKMCNAGVNVGVAHSSGVVYPCYNIQEDIGSIYTGIKFKEKMTVCPAHACKCPLYQDAELYQKAILQTSETSEALLWLR